MSLRIIVLVAGCFLIFPACQTPQPAPPALEPEDVLRLWQGYIDQNQFDSAQLYSTEGTRPFLDFLKSITFVEDSTIISLTLLRDLECRVFGDSALCAFATKDEIGRDVPDTLLLRRIQHRWLVDWHERPNDQSMDSMLKGRGDAHLSAGDSLDPELE